MICDRTASNRYKRSFKFARALTGPGTEEMSTAELSSYLPKYPRN